MPQKPSRVRIAADLLRIVKSRAALDGISHIEWIETAIYLKISIDNRAKKANLKKIKEKV